MSTSSGEAGFCEFCGHPMNVHTSPRFSKCEKCKKRFHVCQAGVHEEGGGWRRCDVPCGCGSRYYPSTAQEAYPLAPTEYASTHPQYESPPEEETSPTYVNLIRNGEYLQFYDHENELVSTVRGHWQQTSVLYEGENVEAWQMVDDTGYSYFTWTLDVEDARGAGATQSERSLGKQAAHVHESSSSHRRTPSAESIDPLQWSDEQFEANTLTPAMARLAVGGSSSHQAQDLGPRERVLGSARLSSKGTVVFKPEGGGEKVNSLRKSWVKVKGGFVFESKLHDCTYFTKEIKPAKK